MGQIMNNLLASLGIITALCFFSASETSAYYFGDIAFLQNYVWCVTDSGLVKINKLDGTYQVFGSIFRDVYFSFVNRKTYNSQQDAVDEITLLQQTNTFILEVSKCKRKSFLS